MQHVASSLAVCSFYRMSTSNTSGSSISCIAERHLGKCHVRGRIATANSGESTVMHARVDAWLDPRSGVSRVGM